MYKKVYGLGAVYAELQRSSSLYKKFFQVEREDGETFVWIGRFHFILTPWKRLSAGLAAMCGFFLDNSWAAMLPSSMPGMKSAAAAAIVAVTSGAAMVSTPCEVEAGRRIPRDDRVPYMEVAHQWANTELKAGATWQNTVYPEVSVRAAAAFSLTSR